MNELDQKIKAALQRADAGAAVGDDEPNFAQEVLTVFRGRHRWLHGAATVVSLLFLAVVIWGLVEFFRAPDLASQLRWAVVSLFSLLFISFIKVWFWLEMHTNRILREVKRVELLLISRGGGATS